MQGFISVWDVGRRVNSLCVSVCVVCVWCGVCVCVCVCGCVCVWCVCGVWCVCVWCVAVCLCLESMRADMDWHYLLSGRAQGSCHDADGFFLWPGLLQSCCVCVRVCVCARW